MTKLKHLNQIRIVLVNSSHPGNIGAAARAMKTMGLSKLYLVNPKQFPHPEATARAVGADNILAKAVVCPDLSTALQNCHLTFACSARSRRLEWPCFDPRQCAEKIQLNSKATVAIVFGCERTGLSNEELTQCQNHVCIPTDKDFASLNLASAVQIIAYEIRQQFLQAKSNTKTKSKTTKVDNERLLATNEQLEGLYQHIQQTLLKVKILDSEREGITLMRRVQRIFNRAELDSTEINILRGFLKAVNKLDS